MSDAARPTSDPDLTFPGLPSPDLPAPRRASLELALLSAIWGGSYFSIEIAQAELGPIAVVLFRVAPAAALLWLVALARRLPLPRTARSWGALLVMGLLNNVLPFTLMSWGQTQIETGLVSILNATTALFGVLVAAAVFADERLTARRLAGVLAGLAGVVLVIGPSALVSLDPRSLAQYAVLAGALSYALASAWAKAALRGLPPVVAAAGMLTGSTLVMLPVTLLAEGAPSLTLSASTWTAIGYYSVLGTALAYLLYYRILAAAGASYLMLCTLIIPPIAILLGSTLLGERLSPTALSGLGCIGLGLALIDGRIFRRRAASTVRAASPAGRGALAPSCDGA